MKDFDEIVATLPTKYRVKNITIGKPPVVRSGQQNTKARKPIMTPAGRFESMTFAADHYNVSKSTITNRILRKEKGYYYVEDN